MEMEQLERMASLIGEPSRVRMLWSLLDGKAYTATELSAIADASRQSTSMHLGKLVEAGLLKVSSQGRHKYYRFASHEAAYAIEAMSVLVPRRPLASALPVKMDPVAYCRTCYDHIAGLTGVKIADRLIELKCLSLENDAFSVTDAGKIFFDDFGIETKNLLSLKRPLAKACLDWSERRFHLAGSLGNALLKKMLADDWLRTMPNSRALSITLKGKQHFYERFGLEV